MGSRQHSASHCRPTSNGCRRPPPARGEWNMHVITKRRFAIGASAMFVGYAATGWRDAAQAAGWAETLSSELARFERESGGRLGVAVLDTLTGAQAGHRADERFPMCSTFKL